MKEKSFYKKLLIIALPIMIQYFITSCLNMMDSLMIGSLGEEAVAGLGIANQFYFIFNIMLMGTYSGAGVLISQYFGSKDMINIKKIIGISLSIGILLGVSFFITGYVFNENIIMLFDKNPLVVSLGSNYLKIVVISYVFMSFTFAFGISSRSIGQAYVPMMTSAMALLFNIILNYGLIFGKLGMPKLGVDGAAYATVISRFIEMVVMISYIYLGKSPLKSKLSELKSFDKEFFKRTFNVILPVVINEICWGLGFVIYSLMYGKLGTKAIASVQICLTLQNIFMIILFATANASCVMLGTKVGEGDLKGVKEYSSKFMRITVVLGILMGASICIFAPHILSIYKVSAEVLTSTKYLLYITGFLIPVRFIAVLLIVGILRGGGSSDIALKIELATMWGVGVPICFIGAVILKLPVYQVFAFVGIEEIVKCIGCLIVYKKGNWIKNLTSVDAKAC